MATKKKKKDDTKVKPSASHIMLYIVLIVYIVVALAGIAFMGLCMATEHYEAGAQTLVTLGSVIGACSCAVVGFYSTKAAKENEIKLSNEKYRMRLELAKEIFKEYGTSLDDKSIDILQRLMSDKDVQEIPVTVPETKWQAPQVDVQFDSVGSDEEGLG